MTQLPRLNPIKILAEEGKYADGLSMFELLSFTRPEDDRFAGVCLWGLGKLQDARSLFIRAIRRGEVAASIEAASICRLLGDLEWCQEYLDIAFDTNLESEDWIFAMRERGELYLVHHEFKRARDAFSEACTEASLCSNNHNLIAAVGQALGWANHILGYDIEAERNLSKAYEKANPVRRTYIQLSRAAISIFRGEYSKTVALLKFSDVEDNFYLNSIKLRTYGMLYLASGDNLTAHSFFKKSIALATEHNFVDVQSSSQIGMCKTFIADKNLDAARTALKRAEHLHANPENLAARELMAGVYWTEVGSLEIAHKHLTRAMEYYKAHHCSRELGWANLHFAAWNLKNGDALAAAISLETVADIAGALDNAAFLIPELRLISDLDALAKIATPYGLNVLKPVLDKNFELSMPLEHRPVAQGFRLQAFGQATLLANGKAVHLTSPAKTYELLAYLLIHPMSTREKILTDVFEEADPKAANNYFHQLKHQLVLNSNGLNIAYDRITRTYTLEAKTATLSWDYIDIMRLLSVPVDTDLNQALDLYAGAFLRHSSAEWVEEVRSNVEWLLVRTGLKVVQDLFERGDFDNCRKMTERLRKVEPLDESLNELLVRATTELDGALAGRRTVAEVERTFGGYGEALPPTLMRLREELKLTLN